MTTEEQPADALHATARDLTERHMMQLAAISTACVHNTRETIKDRITRDSPYWTQSYEDVCVAVDREIRERERAEKAERERDEALAACAEMQQVLARCYCQDGVMIELKRRALSPNCGKGFLAVKSHMEACAVLARVPDDETLYVWLEQLLGRLARYRKALEEWRVIDVNGTCPGDIGYIKTLSPIAREALKEA